PPRRADPADRADPPGHPHARPRADHGRSRARPAAQGRGRRQLRLGGGRRLGQSRRAHRPAPAEVAHRARRLGSGGSADRRREAAQGPGYAGGLMARFGLSSLQTAPPPPQPEAAEPAPAPAPAPKPATGSPAAPP